MKKRLKVAALLGLTAIMAGCSSAAGGGGGGGNGPAPTVTLSATPAGTLTGQSATLTWTSANATSVVIDNGVGSVQLNGSGSVTPSATTTYTITATGNGQEARATAKVTVAPLTVFDGLAEDSTNAGQTDIDPNGAIGTKQYMEYVNTEYQAYDKVTHAPVWATPPQIGTPWANIANSQCAGTGIQLDAVILFDRLASRWVIGAKTTRQQNYDFCIAVSNTDDLSSCASTPTSCWNAYAFNLDPALGTNSHGHVFLPDWPKMGTWPDAYYATMDMNDPDNSDREVGIVACAFDRTNMLAGAAQSALNPMQCVKDTSLLDNGVYVGHSLIPADVDGTTPPPAGRDEFMVSIQNPPLDNITSTSNTFNLWDFHLDWTGNSTLTRTSLALQNSYTPGCYNVSFPTITTCVPEPPANSIGQKIDSVGDRLVPRFAYRNFGAYESFLISTSVQTGLGTGQDITQTGIGWYELRGSGTPAVFQQGMVAPDSNYYRFLPSLAQDHMGNAAVGYSVSNPGTDPAIDLSYWNLSTKTAPAEVIVFNGTAEEISSGNGQGKWGSYSSMTVDPVDDCTFWYVNEYWNQPAGQLVPTFGTKIANFKIPACQ